MVSVWMKYSAPAGSTSSKRSVRKRPPLGTVTVWPSPETVQPSTPAIPKKVARVSVAPAWFLAAPAMPVRIAAR